VSWLLDTNTGSYVLERRFGLAERLEALTLAEARTGAQRSVDPARLLATQ